MRTLGRSRLPEFPHKPLSMGSSPFIEIAQGRSALVGSRRAAARVLRFAPLDSSKARDAQRSPESGGGLPEIPEQDS
jgi:hypothetical protein